MRPVAVVSGASHGIGRETAMRLAQDGFRVRGLGLDAATVRDTCAEAERRGLDVVVLEGDVTRQADVDALAASVRETGGTLRVICNNAAVRPVGTLLETSEEDWDRAFAVNVKGVFRFTRAFLPPMREAGGGSIVTISSCSAMGAAGLIAYSSSKAALIAFSRCLAEDHRADRIRSNVILPGPVESGMIRGLPPELLKWCADNGVQQRLGKPRDVANLVAFLTSEAGETITGAELRVNYWPSLFG